MGEGFLVRKLYENHVPFADADPETLSTALEEIEFGYGIVNHIGHGSYADMSVGLGGATIKRPAVDALTNGDRLFLLHAINCTSAAIDRDAIAEHFLTNPAGGAVAAFGSTRFDFPGTSDAYDKEFYRLLFRDGVRRVGRATTGAKVPFVPLSQFDNSHRWTQFALTLLGDPMLPV